MVYVQRLVEVGFRLEKERVPIHLLLMVERTAVDWDPRAPPGNATIRNAKVKQTIFYSHFKTFVVLAKLFCIRHLL